MGSPDVDDFIASHGPDGRIASDLYSAVELEMATLIALSSLTSPLALDYIDRLLRPIPDLSLEIGAEIVTRAYAAHLVVEADPHRFGAADVPVLGTLPPLRRGSPPQDLLSRVVKVSRRAFEGVCAVSTPVWNGFVLQVTERVHKHVPPDGDGLVSIEVVDGLARFGWVLRQVDIHYGLSPDRQG